MKVTLTLHADDAAPILRKAAYEAAKFGSWCDYITRKTHQAPVMFSDVDEAKKKWREQFLSAKRIVEAFGVEYEPTSEQETLTVTYEYIGGKRVNRGGLFTSIEGSKPDYAHPKPCYRREVHSQACHAAAERVMRAWREAIG